MSNLLMVNQIFYLSVWLICFIWLVNFRILSDMRTLSADWMANSSKSESELQSLQHGGEESKGNLFYPRPVAPTAAQVFVIFWTCFVHVIFLVLIIYTVNNSLESDYFYNWFLLRILPKIQYLQTHTHTQPCTSCIDTYMCMSLHSHVIY